VFNSSKLLGELQTLLGAGGSAKPGVVEIQGEHIDRVTKYLLAHKSQLKNIAGCKEKEVLPVKNGGPGTIQVEASNRSTKDEERKESGKERWSATRLAAVQAARDRSATASLKAPAGWDDDPRRCPFNWIYCSGVCTTQSMEEYARRKQQVE
jgi:hypothetical protein